MKLRTIRQSGFVAIIVAILLMVILTLITVGFTRLMQREQRQAIDRQLSRTALYAAESGVNEVINRIADPAPDPVYDLPAKTNCDPFGLSSSDLSGDGSVGVTCALYDQSPGALTYDIDADNSKIIQLNTTTGDPFSSLTITWGHQNGAVDNFVDPLPSCTNPFVYPGQRGRAVPILRFDLTSANAPYTRDNLLRDTDYMFLVPCDGSGSGNHSFNVTDRGNAVAVPCDITSPDAEPCSVDITGINLVSVSDTMFARVRPVYASARITVSGEDTSGLPVQFSGEQIGVDVTAKANDVVRRIRVSVPLNTELEVPEAAIQLFNGLCKRLDVINETPGSVDIIDECTTLPPPPPTMAVCDLLASGPGIPPYPRIVPDILVSDFDPAIHGVWGSPACNPTSSGCGLSGNFNLGVYAATLPTREDRRYALDVSFWLPDEIFVVQHNPVSRPHIPLDSLNLVVAPGCTYTIDITSYCSFVDPGDPFAVRPPADCNFPGDQPLEYGRVEFFSSYDYGGGAAIPTNLRCTGSIIAFAETTDQSGAPPAETTEWVDSVALQVAGGLSGPVNVNCMRIRHVCDYAPGTSGCERRPIRSSVHFESIGWTVN